MRNRKADFVSGFLLLAFFGALLSCAANTAPLQVTDSLPQSELAYYNDSFDKMREDLWEKAGYLYREEQMQNFKLANMHFDNGRLIIRTKTDSFSKGGLSSKYVLGGDFDIQLNCKMHFIKGIYGMDQVFAMGVYDKSKKIGELTNVNIGLSMKGGAYQGFLFSNCFIDGKKRSANSQKIENFDGTFRIQRSGKTIITSYGENGKPEWIKMNAFRVTDKDMALGFQLRNFLPKRTRIQASHSISVEFDSFRITAAHEIIEEEI